MDFMPEYFVSLKKIRNLVDVDLTATPYIGGETNKGTFFTCKIGPV